MVEKMEQFAGRLCIDNPGMRENPATGRCQIPPGMHRSHPRSPQTVLFDRRQRSFTAQKRHLPEALLKIKPGTKTERTSLVLVILILAIPFGSADPHEEMGKLARQFESEPTRKHLSRNHAVEPGCFHSGREFKPQTSLRRRKWDEPDKARNLRRRPGQCAAPLASASRLPFVARRAK
jgi:hypothetical protein